MMIEIARPHNFIIRQLYQWVIGGRGHWIIVNSVEQIVDKLQEWFESGAADGITILSPRLAGRLDEFVNLVIPKLQRRGLFPTAYGCSTLWDWPFQPIRIAEAGQGRRLKGLMIQRATLIRWIGWREHKSKSRHTHVDSPNCLAQTLYVYRDGFAHCLTPCGFSFRLPSPTPMNQRRCKGGNHQNSRIPKHPIQRHNRTLGWRTVPNDTLHAD